METERKNSRAQVERYDLEILLRRPSLRTNLPRRSSQVRRGTIQTEDTGCGMGCVRGEWIQSFANRKSFIFIYEVLGCFFGSYCAYFFGTITTLEKRFKISSQTIGLVVTVGEIVQILTCFVLCYCASRKNRPRWIGVGMYIVIGSTIVSALPHFLLGPGFNHENTTSVGGLDICSGNPQNCDDEEVLNKPIILLIISQVLLAIGGGLHLTLGASYKNDNINKYQAPTLLSLLSILKTLGPAFGYWLSSMCLKIFVTPILIPNSDESDALWIGAWWLGNLLIGFLLIIPTNLIVLFPTTLPKVALQKTLNEGKGETELLQNSATARRLALTSTFNNTNVSGILSILGFMAYFIFLPKYAETQYRISSSKANFITGSVNLIFSSFGILIASSVITRHRPRAGILAIWNIIVDVLTIGCHISFVYLGCSKADDQIMSMISQLQRNKLNSPQNYFSPVCGGFDDTFISPCYAECKNILYLNNTRVYTDCTHFLLNLNKTKRVVSGACSVDCYYTFLTFTIITCSISFIRATSRASNFWFQIKYTEQTKSTLNFGITFLSVLALVPSPILFGYILDKFCLLWENDCNKTGHCWLYDNQKLRFYMNVTAIGFTVISIMFHIAVWYLVKDLEFHEDDVDFDDDQYIDDNEDDQK